MNGDQLQSASLLAEVLKIQRWAGSDEASASRIFGLVNGIQSEIEPQDPDEPPRMISREAQEKFEDILDEIEGTAQSPDGMSLKSRLRQDGICEHDAKVLLDYFTLQGEFTEAIDMISRAGGSFYKPRKIDSDERNWRGGLHYFEVCYDLPTGENKSIGVYSPTVPRIGETINLRDQKMMQVVDVIYLLADDDAPTNGATSFLLAHVIVEPHKHP